MENKFGVKPKSLQDKNRRLILSIVRSMESITMPELSARIGLSKTTVSKIIATLLEKRFIVSAGKGESSDEGGKRPELFRFNAERAYAVGVHIAPTRISVALADLSGAIIDRKNQDIRENEALDFVVGAIAKSVRGLLVENGLRPESLIGVAVGAHGITDIEKGSSLYSPHFPSWGENVELKRLITEALGLDTVILVDNQIRFQVFAEHVSGVAKGYRDVVVIEGGEGLVAGIIGDGVIQRGTHRLAGEIGHMPLDPYDTQACACGSRGCFEVLVSSSRVVSRYLADGGKTIAEASLETTITPDKLPGRLPAKVHPDLRYIFKAAARGDLKARSCLDETAAWFARGIANLILVVDPQIIVFQGIYAEAGDYFMSRLRDQLTHLAIPNVRKDLIVEYSALGADACLIGATGYLIADYFKRNELWGE